MQYILTSKLLSYCITINHILILNNQTDQAGEYAGETAFERISHGKGIADFLVDNGLRCASSRCYYY